MTASQKVKIVHEFKLETREKWHFLPWSSYERQGLPLKELRPDQRELVHKLLQSSLSDTGYEQTTKSWAWKKYWLPVQGTDLPRPEAQEKNGSGRVWRPDTRKGRENGKNGVPLRSAVARKTQRSPGVPQTDGKIHGLRPDVSPPP